MSKQRMAKATATIYTCAKCDAQHAKWLGQCPMCGTWGTVSATTQPPRGTATFSVKLPHIPTLDTVVDTATTRIATGISEFDLAIGGGIVPGALLLLAGEPGIGKSTLILQVAGAVAQHAEILYITGEETAAQVKQRAERLGLPLGRMRILATIDAAVAATAITTMRPALAIADSIQTLTVPDVPSDAGGTAQVRTLASVLLQTAKTSGVPIIAIGHVTKDGGVAGPKTLEHLVDQVAVLEGDATSDLRVLHTTKNRYGPTDVCGVFSMGERGLVPVADPAAAFLTARRDPAPGTAVTAVTMGSRTLLVEVQALVTRSTFGTPARRAVGFDANRLHVLLAILAQHGGVLLASHDVHVATVGGFRFTDPAADLAVCAALASAAANVPLPYDLLLGEVGLDGRIRPVSVMDRRMREAARLGRTRMAIPAGAPDVHGVTRTTLDTINALTRALRVEHV